MTTSQDFDRLSAYLDNQLSPAEKAGLEARLEHEPELRVALDDLRMAVRALRSLPTVKPPRNFTLSPDRARAIVRPRGVFPALRLATALAAFAFVIAVVGDFATNLAQPRLASAPEVAVTVVAPVSAAPTETLAPLAAQEAITVTRDVSTDNAGATTASANATPDSGTPPISAFAPPVPTVAAGGGASGEAPLQAQPTPAPSATEEAGKRAAETVTATPETEIVVPFVANGAPTPAAPARSEAQTPGALNLPPLRYIEAGLALLTLLLAIAAWLLRSR